MHFRTLNAFKLEDLSNTKSVQKVISAFRFLF